MVSRAIGATTGFRSFTPDIRVAATRLVANEHGLIAYSGKFFRHLTKHRIGTHACGKGSNDLDRLAGIAALPKSRRRQAWRSRSGDQMDY
jgi:hypothetical protein